MRLSTSPQKQILECYQTSHLPILDNPVTLKQSLIVIMKTTAGTNELGIQSSTNKMGFRAIGKERGSMGTLLHALGPTRFIDNLRVLFRK